MIITFLDFDGVINHHKCWAGNLPWRDDDNNLLAIPFAPECIERLNRFARITGTKFVISSSWRKMAVWQDLARVLKNFCGFEGQVIGETPDLWDEPAWQARRGVDIERIERGHEIDEWLRRNPQPELPGVMSINGEYIDQFVILDDDTDMAHLKKFHVHTDNSVGFDEPDLERALWLLPQSEGYLRSL